MDAFSLASTPRLHFGTGKISLAPSTIGSFGSNVMLVTGAKSFISSVFGIRLLEQLKSMHLTVHQCTVENEPTPGMIDDAVTRFSPFNPDVVVAIGGGSVLDAGKAISAMLPLREPVEDYLEGVGTKKHRGSKIPFIAMPTTAGTGSEATKNAVLSRVGTEGYKKSLRHDNFVPDIAIVDPALTMSCTPALTAASGMDAFTQLLESFLSTSANPVTDALAYEGLSHISSSLVKAYREGTNIEARSGMALAAYLSGVTLANAGLGVVHGFASSIGGYFPISHGIICSSLMAAANRITVRKLRQQGNTRFLLKYTAIGKLFSGVEGKSDDYYIDSLLAHIENLSETMCVPRLADCGIGADDYQRIVAATDNKNNPVVLENDELIEVLSMAY